MNKLRMLLSTTSDIAKTVDIAKVTKPIVSAAGTIKNNAVKAADTFSATKAKVVPDRVGFVERIKYAKEQAIKYNQNVVIQKSDPNLEKFKDILTNVLKNPLEFYYKVSSDSKTVKLAEDFMADSMEKVLNLNNDIFFNMLEKQAKIMETYSYKDYGRDFLTQNGQNVLKYNRKGIANLKTLASDIRGGKSGKDSILEYLRKTRKDYIDYQKSSSENLSGPLKEVFDLGMDFQSASIKAMVESTGVGSNKFLQIISSNEELMKKLTPEMRKLVEETRSNCSVTRTVDEAQQYVKKAFKGKYSVLKNIGTGTIGEAYLVKDKNGAEYVVKMLKKGVTEDSLNTERKLYTEIIRKMTPDQKIADQQIATINGLYDGWAEELNFVGEIRNNRRLASGAQRYDVAKIVNASFTDKSKKVSKAIVYEKAEGVPLDKMIEMLKVYKKDPQKYASTYAEQISENPWLKNPDEWANTLPKKYLESISEMLFLPKNGSTMIHGDPHPGNVFIKMDKATKELKPVFIDTGLAVKRSLGEVTDDIGFITDYFVGNSKGLAKRYLDQASFVPVGKTRDELIESIAKGFDESLFKAGINLKSFGNNQKMINHVLDNNGVIVSPDCITLTKAQLQAFSGYGEIADLYGKKGDAFKIISPDLITGVRHSAKIGNMQNLIGNIAPAMKQIKDDFDGSLTTIFQLIS